MDSDIVVYIFRSKLYSIHFQPGLINFPYVQFQFLCHCGTRENIGILHFSRVSNQTDITLAFRREAAISICLKISKISICFKVILIMLRNLKWTEILIAIIPIYEIYLEKIYLLKCCNTVWSLYYLYWYQVS